MPNLPAKLNSFMCLCWLFLSGLILAGASSCSKSNKETQRTVKDSVQVSLLKEVSIYDSTGTMFSWTGFSYSPFGVIDTLRQWDGTADFYSDSNLYVFTIDGQSGLPSAYTEYLRSGTIRSQHSYQLTYANNQLVHSELGPTTDIAKQPVDFDLQPDFATIAYLGYLTDTLTFEQGNLTEYRTRYASYFSVDSIDYSTYSNPYYSPVHRPYAMLFLYPEFLSQGTLKEIWYYFDALSQNAPASIHFKSAGGAPESELGTVSYTWQSFNDQHQPLTARADYQVDAYQNFGQSLLGSSHHWQTMRFDYETVWVYN
jgi:hypothetical protein